ncbi:MAG: PVC-type heme-binding CxxCH protein [Verrucomicrobiales bacterium]
MSRLTISGVLTLLLAALAFVETTAQTLEIPAGDGPGAGKHVVLVSGDEEYRSEETNPMLAKILGIHHGFKTTVLFAINPETGVINPEIQTNIPGLEVLADADLVVLNTRFRDLPDEQLQHFADYVNAGKPLIGLRTATHAFNTKSEAAGFDWNNFGLNYLGEKWVAHHGKHKVEGARGVVVEENADHPVLNGVEDIFAPSDVYTVKNLDEEKATVLVRAAVTETISPDSKILEDDPRNQPMQAGVWLREYTAPSGETGRALTSTMGASVDFKSAGLRRLVVNGVFHLLDLEVPEKANVNPVDPFSPTFFSRNPKEYYEEIKLKPEDFALGKSTATGLASTRKPKSDVNYGKAQKEADSQRPTYEQPGTPERKPEPVSLPFTPAKGERIVFIGNSLGERMLWHGFFEAEMFSRFPDADLFFRNMCHPADTPGFRAHPARATQWAFPGAEKFHPDKQTHFGKGHYPYPDEWLTLLEADTIVAFFGFNESFDGLESVDNFRAELSAFVDHTLAQAYNGKTAPRLVLVTPIAFEDRSRDYTLPQDDEHRIRYKLPQGLEENKRLAAYAEAVEAVAAEKNVGAIDLFRPTRAWLADEETDLTLNGCHLNEDGYEKLAPHLAEQLFGKRDGPVEHREELLAAIGDRNWLWHHDYRMLNGVHVWGQRWAPYGDFNYPEEIEKIRQMTALRDEKVWAAARGETIEVDDSKTRPLTPVQTNYNRPIEYLEPERAKPLFQLPDGYEISLFASEREFPNLRNPVQMSFDKRGRLWVSTVTSYPHYRPGREMPDDKLLIYEDTDGDGKADKEIVFADGLHIPIGFELAPEGVYLSEEPYLMLLQDLDGDDRADKKIRLVDGFDSHDTHHAISSYSADASGAFYLCEGRFLHSQVETPYGPQRMTDGGLWRFDPRTWKLIRHSQADYSNPWAVAFDEYGQDFLGDASPGANWWLLPLSVKVPHGYEIGQVEQFTTHQVRPTSGGEFVYSRHFPEQSRGHYLLNNTIGFLGTKQHTMIEDGAGFTGTHYQDLVRSDDGNFRPCDLEFAPDGSLYIVDWHNALIGHMQHSARDPNRSSDYGRIYRVTYAANDLVDPPVVAGAAIEQLLANLELDEYRARYRTRRELREHPAAEVTPAVKKWLGGLDKSDPKYGRHLLEGLWATWAQGFADDDLVAEALGHPMHQVRCGAVDVIRFNHEEITGALGMLFEAARDEHPRVRLETIVAASWLDDADGARLLFEALRKPLDRWMGPAVEAAWVTLKPHADGIDLTDNPVARQLVDGQLDLAAKQEERPELPANLEGTEKELWLVGEEIYHRDGYCTTCHGVNGLGTVPDIYPPLVDSEWVTGNVERLAKLTLHGLWGPMEVKDKLYDPAKGVPPMTAFGPMLDDEEIAGVLTYVRNAWGNQAAPVEPATVSRIRKQTESRGPGQFYKPEELLKEHPLE